MNKTAELLNMFSAAAHVQETLMYDEESNSYKLGYQQIFRAIAECYPEISQSVEYKVFELGLRCWNDLFDMYDELVAVSSYESRDLYFQNNVQRYVDQYLWQAEQIK